MENVTHIIHCLAEELVLAAEEKAKGTWEEDYDRVLAPHVKDAQPCYLMYR